MGLKVQLILNSSKLQGQQEWHCNSRLIFINQILMIQIVLYILEHLAIPLLLIQDKLVCILLTLHKVIFIR